MKNIFTFLILEVLSITVYGQKQADIWYFGNHAGIDFNSGVAVALSNGALYTIEGCSSICDSSGNLLFYTDGVNVYNKIHASMPNGFGLAGGISSSQSALIVPEPGSSTLYYIFTIAQVTGSSGFCYSIVDMTLDGGNGDVINKNTLILNSVPLCEMLAGTMHSNGLDVWVCVHDLSDAIYTYLVTSSGITPAIISNTGTNYGASYQGYLKFNHSGSKLAASVYSNLKLDLFDFDNTTGAFSNPATSVFPGQNPYGVEFSPADTKLYVTAGAATFYIYQFDMNAGSNAAIVASAIPVDSNSTTSYIFGIQAAPDGKIYVSYYNNNWIGAIISPELPGVASNVNDSALYLAGAATTEACLPNYISNYLQITGINENLSVDNYTIQISPNPFVNAISITIHKQNIKHTSFFIYNVLGQIVFHEQENNLNNTDSKTIDLSELSQGIYFLDIIINEERTVKRIMKE
jgi:hypothetical protein